MVIAEYLDGVRKRYMPPIVFVSFGVALSSIVMNIYSDEYLKFTNSFSNAQYELIQDGYENGTLDEKANFCSNCGARIVHQWITTQFLANMFLANYIGWDNRFLSSNPIVLANSTFRKSVI